MEGKRDWPPIKIRAMQKLELCGLLDYPAEAEKFEGFWSVFYVDILTENIDRETKRKEEENGQNQTMEFTIRERGISEAREKISDDRTDKRADDCKRTGEEGRPRLEFPLEGETIPLESLLEHAVFLLETCLELVVVPLVCVGIGFLLNKFL